MNPDSPLSPELQTIADGFLWNAENALADSSPLYARLARRIASDPEILSLAAHTQPHQPVMNMLFASVHYLLLRDNTAPLAAFFPDLTPHPNLTDDPYPIFRAFCLEHAHEIIELERSRRVQTNEIARCALFLPAFTLIARRLRGQSFALLEVGSSAGLNLNWERYGYDYGDGQLLGDAASGVLLKCELRGALRPPLPRNGERLTEAFTSTRIGIDLNPNDVFDDDAMLWLRALVWSEQIERADRLQKAIALARVFPPKVLQGDALELAPRLIQESPRAVPIVLFHSFVLNQVPQELRVRYGELLAANSADRTLIDLAIEPGEFPAPLVLTTCRNETTTQEILATCDHHGRWLEWRHNDASL